MSIEDLTRALEEAQRAGKKADWLAIMAKLRKLEAEQKQKPED